MLLQTFRFTHYRTNYSNCFRIMANGYDKRFFNLYKKNTTSHNANVFELLKFTLVLNINLWRASIAL